MKENIPDTGFRMMGLVMKFMEWIHPQAENRAKTFDIKEGMTVVDYGCGPGRYTLPFAKLVGCSGHVIAVDLSPLAIEAIGKKVREHDLNNVSFSLAKGYDSGVEEGIADVVIALDMFFMIEQPAAFLTELSRICKPDGILVIDDGHQSRAKTKMKLEDAGIWRIVEERKDHLKCKKK